MLREFLADASATLKATGHREAVKVAEMLAEVEVPQHWQKSTQPTALRQLPEALASSDCHPAAEKLGAIAQHLQWQEAQREMPKTFVGKYCFAIIVGPAGMIKDDRFNFGTYFQSSETFYPSHSHQAVELYLPLAGSALWQRDSKEFQPVTPGTLIHHPSYLPHATRTLADPMLAIWSWTGELSFDTYTIAND